MIRVGAGALLGTLLGGRVSISIICTHYMSLAMVIAICYSAVRKQFGPTEENELPVIEYQAQVRMSILSSCARFGRYYIVIHA